MCTLRCFFHFIVFRGTVLRTSHFPFLFAFVSSFILEKFSVVLFFSGLLLEHDIWASFIFHCNLYLNQIHFSVNVSVSCPYNTIRTCYSHLLYDVFWFSNFCVGRHTRIWFHVEYSFFSRKSRQIVRMDKILSWTSENVWKIYPTSYCVCCLQKRTTWFIHSPTLCQDCGYNNMIYAVHFRLYYVFIWLGSFRFSIFFPSFVNVAKNY